jgi:hypothetical protein
MAGMRTHVCVCQAAPMVMRLDVNSILTYAATIAGLLMFGTYPREFLPLSWGPCARQCSSMACFGKKFRSIREGHCVKRWLRRSHTVITAPMYEVAVFR